MVDPLAAPSELIEGSQSTAASAGRRSASPQEALLLDARSNLRRSRAQINDVDIEWDRALFEALT
jgi:hypothetical protein